MFIALPTFLADNANTHFYNYIIGESHRVEARSSPEAVKNVLQKSETRAALREAFDGHRIVVQKAHEAEY